MANERMELMCAYDIADSPSQMMGESSLLRVSRPGTTVSLGEVYMWLQCFPSINSIEGHRYTPIDVASLPNRVMLIRARHLQLDFASVIGGAEELVWVNLDCGWVN